MASGTNGTKRYTLVLPNSVFEQVQQLANAKQTTIVELLRKFIKLGLVAYEVQEKPDAALILREGNTEKEILLL